jgi:hypothetical protein
MHKTKQTVEIMQQHNKVATMTMTMTMTMMATQLTKV